MFVYKKKILFGDCDSAGILFFANIFRYMHETYEKFIDENLSYNEHFGNENVAYPVIKTDAEYFSPFLLGEETEIRLSVNEVRNSSFELLFEFYVENILKAKGKTVHVCVSIPEAKKEPLNNKLKELLRKHISVR